ncbi:MAG TPA: gliding motility-associated C-terminal domain-containing protein [Edaphocola sp.]|nr:gliding motility-associated C-terminal domain-containing protein [Edaphocola sp.]
MKQGIMDSITSGKTRHSNQVHQALRKGLVIMASCFTLLGTGTLNAQVHPGNPMFNAPALEHAQARSLDFIENKGQWDPDIKYRANIAGGAMFMTNNGFVYSYVNEADLEHVHHMVDEGASIQDIGKAVIHQYAYKVNFIDANQSAIFEPSNKRNNYNNYIIGNDRSKWTSFVPLFGIITQKDIYQGINLVVYSQHNAPKYDFLVAPNADPNQIKLDFEGVSPVLTSDGDLKIKTTVNEIMEQAPVAYQMINGVKVDVPVKYALKDNRITFDFPHGYQSAYSLIIDPQLVFCTYANGQNDYSFTTTYDYDGCTLVGGQAWQTGWPTTVGAFQTTFGGNQDVCINKYNPLGTSLIYSTYYGGSNIDLPHSLRVNAQNELYIIGSTTSSNLPHSSGCVDSTLGGNVDIFVAHLNYTGSQLLGGTYIGGSGDEPLAFSATGTSSLAAQLTTSPLEVQFDTLGNPWIVGNTASIDFPVTTNAQQSNFSGGAADGVIFKLTPNCSQLLYSSYLGGSGTDALYGIQFNSKQQAVVCGFTESIDFPTTDSVLNQSFLGQRDGVVAIINPQNGNIEKSTYLGTITADVALQLQIDSWDNIYIMGQCSGDYPVSNNVYSVNFGNVFIDKLSSDLDSSLLSTVVGGSSFYPDGFLLDICGNIYVTGLGAPANLPTTQDAFKQTGGPSAPFWFCVLKPNFSGLLYGSYFGVSGDHTHCGISRLDPEGIVYHSICNASQYPDTTAGAYQTHYSGNGQDIVTFKFDFQATGVVSHIQAASGGKDTTGCAPFTLYLGNASTSPYSITNFWNAGDGSPLITTNSFTHTYDSAGDYTVVLHAHSDSACVQDDYDTFTVHVVAVNYPQISVTPDTLLCNLETSLPLWVHIANPDSNNSIEWWPANGVISGGATDTAIVDPTINTYYVRVRDSIDGLCGFSSVDTVHIDFFPRSLTINTNDTTVCKGSQVQVDAQSAQGYTFVWSPVNGVNDSTAINPVITANQSITYTLTAHHPGCLDTAQTLTINVQEYPVVDLGPNLEFCQWANVPLTANISPYRNDYTYEWTPAAVGMDFPNSPNAHITADTSGWFYLKVTTPVGCSGEDSVHLTVFPGNFGAVATDTGYCPPNEVHLWAAGASHYKWTPAFGLSDTTSADPVARPSTTTNYTVYMEDVHGCKDTGNVLVTVYPSATLTLPDSITVYPGEDYHLEPATNCVYFNWFPTNGVSSTTVSDPVFNPSVRTRYFVTAKTENGCVVTDSMDVLVEGTVINMANAFTPGVGVNGTYKVSKRGIASLKEFAIYNRWGNKVFSTTDINEGWDGNFNGKPQPTGVYIYTIDAVTNSGQPVVRRGNVTLIR